MRSSIERSAAIESPRAKPASDGGFVFVGVELAQPSLLERERVFEETARDLELFLGIEPSENSHLHWIGPIGCTHDETHPYPRSGVGARHAKFLVRSRMGQKSGFTPWDFR
jgi:hypothetical protein